MASPVIDALRGEARKATTSATSLGVDDAADRVAPEVALGLLVR